MWYALYAPTGTAPAVIDKVNAGVAQFVSDPAPRKRLA